MQHYSCLRLEIFVSATKLFQFLTSYEKHNIPLPDNFYQLLNAAAVPRVYKYAVLFVPRAVRVLPGNAMKINYIKLSRGEGSIAFHLVTLYNLYVAQLSYLPRLSSPSSI